MATATRRNFTKALAMLAPFQAASPAPEASIDELNLSPDVFADLKSFAQPVLAQARYLEELPLEGADPGFVFTPK